MHTFFHGWRRKAGCVFLVTACVLMAAWLRGGFQYDFFDLNIQGMTYRLGTHGGQLRFITQGPTNSPQLVSWDTGKLEELLPYQPGQSRDPWYGIDVDWRWDFYDFHAGAGQYPRSNLQTAFCVFPYWSIVPPLALLSAYLILVPSRTRPPTASQPHA
ncbi:MAG: hypothetical protein JWP89_3631 [Schlesneria sp.]|nr:hypothetical protein [Schlesneria sp.]